MIRRIPPTIWVIALLLAGCGDSCCDDPVDHLCYFDRTDGGIDSSVPSPEKFEESVCVTPRVAADDADAGCSSDKYEPNGDFVTASLPRTPECGMTTKKDVTVTSGSDVDVFRTGSCQFATSSLGFGLSLTPWAESSDDVQVCIFPTCDDGSTRILSCLATLPGVIPTSDMKAKDENFATSELGFHGCCRAGGGRITAVLDCPLHSRKIDTFVWVEALEGQQCSSYSVSYEVE